MAGEIVRPASEFAGKTAHLALIGRSDQLSSTTTLTDSASRHCPPEKLHLLFCKGSTELNLPSPPIARCCNCSSFI